MAEQKARAERYRHEAAELRRAVKFIQDERFREQLLSIADQFDAFADAIEAEIESKKDC